MIFLPEQTPGRGHRFAIIDDTPRPSIYQQWKRNRFWCRSMRPEDFGRQSWSYVAPGRASRTAPDPRGLLRRRGALLQVAFSVIPPRCRPEILLRKAVP